MSTEALDGWPCMSAVGNVVHIRVEPAKETPWGCGADRENAVHFRAVVVEGDQTPIVAARPRLDDGWDLEGGSFGDGEAHGWQVVPYSSTKKWVCELADADSILVRGALQMPSVDGAGHISFAEARRMGAALIALADQAEAQTGGAS